MSRFTRLTLTAGAALGALFASGCVLVVNPEHGRSDHEGMMAEHHRCMEKAMAEGGEAARGGMKAMMERCPMMKMDHQPETQAAPEHQHDPAP